MAAAAVGEGRGVRVGGDQGQTGTPSSTARHGVKRSGSPAIPASASIASASFHALAINNPAFSRTSRCARVRLSRDGYSDMCHLLGRRFGNAPIGSATMRQSRGHAAVAAGYAPPTTTHVSSPIVVTTRRWTSSRMRGGYWCLVRLVYLILALSARPEPRATTRSPALDPANEAHPAVDTRVGSVLGLQEFHRLRGGHGYVLSEPLALVHRRRPGPRLEF